VKYPETEEKLSEYESAKQQFRCAITSEVYQLRAYHCQNNMGYKVSQKATNSW
jgi:hypothetical protein